MKILFERDGAKEVIFIRVSVPPMNNHDVVDQSAIESEKRLLDTVIEDIAQGLQQIDVEAEDQLFVFDEDFGEYVPLTSFRQLTTASDDDASLPFLPLHNARIAAVPVGKAPPKLSPKASPSAAEPEHVDPASLSQQSTPREADFGNIAPISREHTSVMTSREETLGMYSREMTRESTMAPFGMYRTPSTIMRGGTTSSLLRARTQSHTQQQRRTRHNIRMILVRHGESEGNVNKSIYNTKPDHALELTENGRSMARNAGTAIKNFLEQEYGMKENMDHHVRMWVSPYTRTRQTAEEILSVLNPKVNRSKRNEAESEEPQHKCWVDSVRESPFLAEQDFGSSEGDGGRSREVYAEEFERLGRKRDYAGQYWARWPHGESYFDVCVRMSGIFSDITAGFMLTPPSRPPIRTVIIVSHGVTIRALLSTWCRYSPEWLAHTQNPPNCSVQLLDDYKDRGYIFGGYNNGKEVPLSDLPRTKDPNQQKWDNFLVGEGEAS